MDAFIDYACRLSTSLRDSEMRVQHVESDRTKLQKKVESLQQEIALSRKVKC